METTDRIKSFLKDEILFDNTAVVITDETHLLDGVIDSLALMQLVGFLEEEFEVQIDDGEITATHFRTVADIARLVSAKQGANA